MSDRQRDTGIREIAIKNPDLVASYSTIFLQVASRGTPFSGEDVTRAFRERDGRRPTHPSWFGAMFGNTLRQLVAAGRVRYVGMAKMHSPRNHSNQRPLYQLIEKSSSQ